MANPVLPPADHDDRDHDDRDAVARRIAAQTLATRSSDYSAEVRRLIDAGRDVMRRRGTESRPRVADIVDAAGLSNDAFYRHFPSKDALVAAILEDGTERLHSYLRHQMEKADDPADEVRRWVSGVLTQASEDSATTTLAVMWNAGALSDAIGSPSPATVLAPLLVAPVTALGSPDPDLDALLVARTVVATLSDHLRRRAAPSDADVARVTDFCLSAVAGAARS